MNEFTIICLNDGKIFYYFIFLIAKTGVKAPMNYLRSGKIVICHHRN